MRKRIVIVIGLALGVSLPAWAQNNDATGNPTSATPGVTQRTPSGVPDPTMPPGPVPPRRLQPSYPLGAPGNTPTAIPEGNRVGALPTGPTESRSDTANGNRP